MATKVKVFLTQDVQNVGMSGEIVQVTDGFAKNFVVPRKLGILVNATNEGEFTRRLKKVEKRDAVIKSKTSMLAEKIKSLRVTITSKMHDDGKLYGAIRPQAIVEALAAQGVSISKSMVDFPKPIKEKGEHTVTIKLSANLQPALTIKVVAE